MGAQRGAHLKDGVEVFVTLRTEPTLRRHAAPLQQVLHELTLARPQAVRRDWLARGW